MKETGIKAARMIGTLAISLWIYAVLGISGNAVAAECTHYVSNSGSSSWNAATNISTPTDAATAFANASAGNVVCFRGGTYELGQNSGNTAVLGPANSGAEGAPITFMAYPGETPVLNGHITMKVTGTAGAGSNNYQLVDNSVDFIAAGVTSWDTVRTLDKDSGAVVAESSGGVTQHVITLAAEDVHNAINLAPGDRYEIAKALNLVLSNNYKSHIVFDGFSVMSDNGERAAKVRLAGSDTNNIVNGLVLRNCVINGGNIHVYHGDNHEGIRLDNTRNALIQNCTVYNFNQIEEWHNTSAIKMYRNYNPVIENCEIYNSTAGIFDKGLSDGATYRYNYIHNCARSVVFTGYGWENPDGSLFTCTHRNVKFYHNVVAHSSYGSFGDTTQEWSDSDNMEVYNNTFFTGNAKSVSVGLGGGGKRFYNNILVGLPFDNDVRQYRLNMAGTVAVRLDESDYNQFGDIPGSFGVKVVKPDPNNAGSILYLSYTSLAAWQNSAELSDGSHPDIHSLASDPLFANPSGNYSGLSDFNLQSNSPCKGTGKDGIDMGADISLVGPQGYCAAHGVAIQAKSAYYTSIAAAFDAAETGDTILAQAMIFEECPGVNKDITIKGGYNCGFTENTGYSTIIGKVTVGGSGSINIDNLIIR